MDSLAKNRAEEYLSSYFAAMKLQLADAHNGIEPVMSVGVNETFARCAEIAQKVLEVEGHHC